MTRTLKYSDYFEPNLVNSTGKKKVPFILLSGFSAFEPASNPPVPARIKLKIVMGQ